MQMASGPEDEPWIQEVAGLWSKASCEKHYAADLSKSRHWEDHCLDDQQALHPPGVKIPEDEAMRRRD